VAGTPTMKKDGFNISCCPDWKRVPIYKRYFQNLNINYPLPIHQTVFCF